MDFLRSQCDISVFFLSMYCLNTKASKVLGDVCGATGRRCLGPESPHGERKSPLTRKVQVNFQDNGNILKSLTSEPYTLIDPGF